MSDDRHHDRRRDTIFWRRIVRAELPLWKVALLGLSLLAIVSLLDYITGTAFSISPLYLLPAAVVAWWGGFRMGAVMSALCTIAWAVADMQGGRSRPTIVIYGEGVLRCAFYCVFAWAVAALREAGRTLQAMVDARTAALQTLAAELSAAEDAQRRQVAYDIHDAIGQNLSLLKLRLEGLRESEDQGNSAGGGGDNGAPYGEARFRHWLDREIELVDDLIRQTRTLSFELYPPVLDDLGLTPALQGYADQMRERVAAEVMVMEQGTSQRLETSLAHFVFRAIKELVGNAVRHGKAAQVIVSLHWRPGGLRIVVDDDGGGFRAADTVAADASPATARRGLGLAGIRQRIGALGGTAQIESRPGEGTRAILEIPIASTETQPPSQVFPQVPPTNQPLGRH
jgi:signal transduction histidine kinase